jgi:hypothetical protein
MKVESIPEGYGAVTPFIIVKGAAQLLDFMREAFGAEEMGRVVGEDGSIGHGRNEDRRLGRHDVRRERRLALDTELPPPLRRRRRRGVPTGVEGWSHLGDRDDEHALARPGRPCARPVRQSLVDHDSHRRRR